MPIRIWWMLQGAFTTAVIIFGLSIILQTLFGAPTQEATTAIMPIWYVVAALTLFNTVMLIYNNYKEPI